MKKYDTLKQAGAKYTQGVGWAIPDPNTGTCWFDESSYNGTIFLGRNTAEALATLSLFEDNTGPGTAFELLG